MPREFRLEHISEDSEIYENLADEYSQDNFDMLKQGIIFGGDLIQKVHERIGDKEKGQLDIPMDRLIECSDLITNSKNSLIQASQAHGYSKESYIKLVSKFYTDESFKVFFTNFIYENKYEFEKEALTVEDLLSDTDKIIRLIPGNLYFALITKHVHEMVKKNVDFRQNKAPFLVEGIKKKLVQAIDSNRLPINSDRIEERLSRISYSLQDGLMTNSESLGGFYRRSAQSIVVQDSVKEKNYEEVLIHEIMHAISGSTELVALRADDHIPDDLPEKELLINQRLGLSYFSFTNKNNIFTWLNEALTEKLSMDVLGMDDFDDSNAYISERMALDAILKKVPYDMFKAAYFENYDVNESDKVPAWKALQKKIGEVYGPNFLQKFSKKLQAALDDQADLSELIFELEHAGKL